METEFTLQVDDDGVIMPFLKPYNGGVVPVYADQDGRLFGGPTISEALQDLSPQARPIFNGLNLNWSLDVAYNPLVDGVPAYMSITNTSPSELGISQFAINSKGSSSLIFFNIQTQDTWKLESNWVDDQSLNFGINGDLAIQIDKERTVHLFGVLEMDACVKVLDQSEPDTPSGGGAIFVSSGALKYKGSSGTVTTLAVA